MLPAPGEPGKGMDWRWTPLPVRSRCSIQRSFCLSLSACFFQYGESGWAEGRRRKNENNEVLTNPRENLNAPFAWTADAQNWIGCQSLTVAQTDRPRCRLDRSDSREQPTFPAWRAELARLLQPIFWTERHPLRSPPKPRRPPRRIGWTASSGGWHWRRMGPSVMSKNSGERSSLPVPPRRVAEEHKVVS